MERLGNPGDYGPMSEQEQSEATSALFHGAPDEPIEAEVVDDDDPSEVWGQIVFAAGSYSWTTKQLTDKYAEHNQGEMPGSDVPAMKRFLADVKAGRIR